MHRLTSGYNADTFSVTAYIPMQIFFKENMRVPMHIAVYWWRDAIRFFAVGTVQFIFPSPPPLFYVTAFTIGIIT